MEDKVNLKAYRVKNWPQIFESHESRKYKRLEWIRLPSTMTGKGFKRVALHADNVQLFCAFVLILEVAAVMPERGTLIDAAGLPLDASDLALMTGYPEEIFGHAMNVLTEPKIGWLEHIEDVEQPQPSCPAPENAGRCRERPGDSPGTPGDAGRDRDGTGDHRVLELRLRKEVRSSRASIAKSAVASAVKTKLVPSPEEKEFIEALTKAVGSKAMVNWGGKWRLRFRENAQKAQRVLADVREGIQSGKITVNPGGYANKMWGVFV